MTVRATGPAWMGAQATDTSEHDLVRAEVLSAPLVLLILIIVFRSVVAAMIPLLVTAVAVTASLALLRPLAALLPLSVFSTNLTTALGFGLTVDYCLFLLTRYRHELSAGRNVGDAIATAVRTAGRAAIYSAVTLSVALSALLFFPVPFLRSMALAGMVVAMYAATASCILVPALLMVLGRHVNRWDPLNRFRRAPAGTLQGPWRPGRFWTATARAVTNRPLLWAAGALVMLGILVAPFTHVRWGPIDERVLPDRARSHAVADEVRKLFPSAAGSNLVIAAPGSRWGHDANAWDDYARAWALAEPQGVMTSADASFRAGTLVGPGDPAMAGRDGTWLGASVPGRPESSTAGAAVHTARALRAPVPVLVGGDAARFVDTQAALKETLPIVAVIISLGTGLLFFLFTGSVFLPVKTIVVAALSMSACFGAVVRIFQDGNAALLVGSFTVTGTVNACILLLLFCIAFGLDGLRDVPGIAHPGGVQAHRRQPRRCPGRHHPTGGLVTAAAAVVMVAMAGLTTSAITLLKLLGFGPILGAFIDATLVRTLLVPPSCA